MHTVTATYMYMYHVHDLHVHRPRDYTTQHNATHPQHRAIHSRQSFLELSLPSVFRDVGVSRYLVIPSLAAVRAHALGRAHVSCLPRCISLQVTDLLAWSTFTYDNYTMPIEGYFYERNALHIIYIVSLLDSSELL